jgi:hypothetical protein
MKLFLSILILFISLFFLFGCEETSVRVAVFAPPRPIVVYRPPVVYRYPVVVPSVHVVHRPVIVHAPPAVVYHSPVIMHKPVAVYRGKPTIGGHSSFSHRSYDHRGGRGVSTGVRRR